MIALRFNLDIDAEIEKLMLPPAKAANSANQGEMKTMCREKRGRNR